MQAPRLKVHHYLRKVRYSSWEEHRANDNGLVAVQLPSSSTTGPSLGTPIPLQEIPGSSPSRRTIFPLNRPPASSASTQSTPQGPKPSSSGQATASSGTYRLKSPWTPANADKGRLAQAIMRSLGRPSTGTQSPSPARPPPSSSQGSVNEDSAANKRKRTPSVTESPTQKKQKVGVEVEEIATDGAFELAVWQQQQGSDVTGPEADSSQRPGPSHVPDEPVQIEGVMEGQSAHVPQVDAEVNGLGGAPTLVEGTFAPPAPFPSIGDYLGMRLSQPPADVEPRAPDVERNEQVAVPPVQEAPSSPRRSMSVGTAPPTSRTTSPPAAIEPPSPSIPKTPVAESGPSTAKTPLFFPSPTSERGRDVGGENASDQEEERDPAAVFASVFSANANLVTSPRRIPTRAKGKARMVVNDSEDEDSRSASSKSKAQRKQRVVSSGSDVQSGRAKKRGSQSVQWDDSEAELLDDLSLPKKSALREASRPIVNRAYVLVPRMPTWAKKLREKEKEAERQKTKQRKARKTSTPETVPESVDELAVDDGAW